MWLNTLRQRWLVRSRPVSTGAARRRSLQQRPRPNFRPRLQALEDRTLLSGTLPYAEPIYTAQLAADISYANNNPGSYTINLPRITNYLLTGALPALASGDNLTIHGNGDGIAGLHVLSVPPLPFRLFDVQSGASLTLDHLTLSGGLAEGTGAAAEGGAIYSSGNLSLTDVTVSGNEALGSNGANGAAGSGSGEFAIAPGQGGHGAHASGGGVFVTGATAILTLTNDTFSNNSAVGGKGGVGGTGAANPLGQMGGKGGVGGNGSGGGLYAGGGSVHLANVLFIDNMAQGGAGGTGGSGGKGGTSLFTGYGGKGGIGGGGGTGGSAMGGGLYVGGNSNLTLSQSILRANSAEAGVGGAGGNGGNVVLQRVNNSTGNGGEGGKGGNAAGGSVYVADGKVLLTEDTLSNNQADGNKGGKGGNSLTDGDVLGTGSGGGGGSGGSASGGALYVLDGAVTLDNSTLSNNALGGGPGGIGGSGANPTGTSSSLHFFGGSGGNGGSVSGGGLYVDSGAVSLINDTVDGNNGIAGAGGAGGKCILSGGGPNGPSGSSGNQKAGGMYVSGPVNDLSINSVNMANTLIADNTVGLSLPTPSDVHGDIMSSDHDLIGDSRGFSASSSNGDLYNFDPKLQPLADNGGPLAGAPGTQQVVPTVALSAGSPAIDAGDNSAAPGATGQRGYARIAGFAIDIGAYEYGATPATTNLFVSGQAAYGTAPGGEIVYNVTVRNLSSTAQSNVTLADVLPANTTLVSWMPAVGDGDQSAWSHDAPAIGASGTVTAWIASLPGKTSADFALIVQVNSSTPAGRIIADAAWVGPVTGDPRPGNNSKTFYTTVTVGTIVSTGIQVSSGKISYDNTTGLWIQKVKITNTSDTSLFGSLALELTNLRSNVTLVNAVGIAPNGDPYIDFASPLHSLAPGQSITLTLEFSASTAASIKGYSADVYQGL